MVEIKPSRIVDEYVRMKFFRWISTGPIGMDRVDRVLRNNVLHPEQTMIRKLFTIKDANRNTNGCSESFLMTAL